MSKKITLTSSEKIALIAPDSALHPNGIKYKASVINGSMPGPVMAIDQRDVLEITFKNDSSYIQSLIFDAGYGPSRAFSGNVEPGDSKTWDLIGNTPGAFLYYSGGDGLNGVWEQIANGMYGAIIVHPDNEKPAKEFCVVFSEIYNDADAGLFIGSSGSVGGFDLGKFYQARPDLHLTNGISHRYLPSIGGRAKLPLNPDLDSQIAAGDLTNLFKVKPGELTRWYLLNAGPNEYVAFSFMGNISNVSRNPASDSFTTPLNENKPWSIPPGAGIVVETVFPEEGIYVGLDRNISHFTKGAGFAVVATHDAKPNDHPPGSHVPSKGSQSPISE